MISLGEIRAALDGSWLLLRNRPEGMAFFDQSIQGFWRSFLVIGLLVPLLLVSGLAEKQFYFAENLYHPDAFPDSAFWFAQLAGFGIDWLALPLLLALVAVPIGISHRYVPFIVVRNWSSLLVSIPYMVTYLLFLLGLISTGITVLLSLTCLVVVIWYRYLVARIALQASVSLAIGVVVLDVVLTLLISQIVGLMWGA
ncbi:hypothetical protein [Roseibium sediminicola]|uniref:Yip1 domain-containing protein n=1 Tax=Roseibium sediminicola TaxID=2933272 RepID=A0ABT0GX70_9HYPH|nr:hypothetical protein [Roseibium sp. CAU 1639]MCK7614042.1 hypothetical protein [Roseibium sp. CAU 1639]